MGPYASRDIGLLAAALALPVRVEVVGLIKILGSVKAHAWAGERLGIRTFLGEALILTGIVVIELKGTPG